METFEKLPVEFKQKWVAALRSEEYRQAIGELVAATIKDEEDEELEIVEIHGYCCLGVACVISGIPEKRIVGEQLINGEVINLLPEGFPEILIGDNNGTNPLVMKLTRMNDGHSEFRAGELFKITKRHSFKEIADWIEENL